MAPAHAVVRSYVGLLQLSYILLNKERRGRLEEDLKLSDNVKRKVGKL